MAKKITDRTIDTTIMAKIASGAVFTAYDITLALRKMGYHAIHREVRKLVHQYQLPAAYTRTLTKVSKDAEAYVYHQVTATTQTKSDYIAQTIKFVPDFGSRGRFSIHAANLRAASLLTGHTVQIHAEKGKILIGKISNGRSATVDKSNNIRIRHSDFVKAFNTMPTKVMCKVTEGVVEVVRA